MSSAYAAVRADTGLCQLHDRFHRSADICRDYDQEVPALTRS